MDAPKDNIMTKKETHQIEISAELSTSSYINLSDTCFPALGIGRGILVTRLVDYVFCIR